MTDDRREGRAPRAFPRLLHWLTAAGLLFFLTLAVPVLAGLT